MIATDLRYRPRLGRPRSTIERVVQFCWRWRVELVLMEISASVAVVIAIELLR